MGFGVIVSALMQGFAFGSLWAVVSYGGYCIKRAFLGVALEATTGEGGKWDD